MNGSSESNTILDVGGVIRLVKSVQVCEAGGLRGKIRHEAVEEQGKFAGLMLISRVWWRRRESNAFSTG
jgi:hypothetical protein